MSDRLVSLTELVDGIGPGRFYGARVSGGADLGGLFVRGVDFHMDEGRLEFSLHAESDVPPAREQLLRRYLERLFGVRGVVTHVTSASHAPAPEPALIPTPERAMATDGKMPSAIVPASFAPVSVPPMPEPTPIQESAGEYEFVGDDAPPGEYEFAAGPPPAAPAKGRGGASGKSDYPARARKSTGKSAGADSRDKIKAGSFARSMKGIDYEDGSYFADNPAVICGAPVKQTPTRIADISPDQLERVTVRGEVVTVDYRPIKDGEAEIMECGIYDGTGSVMVKQFIAREFLQQVKPKLNRGAYIAVRGEMQYDPYLKDNALFAVDIGLAERVRRSDGAARKRVELHMHTQMSAMDAISSAGELVKLAAEFGHPAVAVTDHGVVQAFPDAFEAGRKHKIKVIYGIEAYLDTADEPEYPGTYHIILLAKNRTGLKNLYKLVSKSHLEYFYRRPLMPRREIEAHREGLIVGSACESGELYRAVLAGADHSRLLGIAGYYDYLEIQPNGNNRFLIRANTVASDDGLCDINRRIVSLGEELGRPVVATGDVHFAEPDDEVFRRILMAGQNFSDAESQPPLYFRNTDDMLHEFSYLGDEKAFEVVVTNPNLVNGWVEEGLRPIPDGMYSPVIEGADEELKDIVEKKLAALYGENAPELVRARLDQEMDTIISKNFSVLYMIAHRLVKKSNEDGYMVGSRGSVGSSLVALLAGISEVDPLPPHYLCPVCRQAEFVTDGSVSSGFDLPAKNCPGCGAAMKRDGQDIMFEIFIGAKGSEKAPDIDLNFSGEYQLRAHKYTEELFGAKNVCKAGTIGTIADKTAYGFVKKYLESKSQTPGRVEEERLIRGCAGVKRTTGQHPGGLIVIPHGYEVYDFTPVQHPADATGSDVITTHFDFNALKETILKLDLLGHDDPSIIKMLEDLTGVRSDEIDMNDPAIQSLFSGTEALGVTPGEIGSEVGTLALPEFGTRFLRQMLVETKPKCFSDLLQISGLSHGTNVWLNNAQDLIRDGTCTISEVIGTRESLVLYLMRHGLDQLTSFQIMEAVRKNKGVSPENEQKMLDKGVPQWYIDSCNKVEYLFPKAHATAYVQMAYWQAWYKINRPHAFYAAYFSIRADDFDAEDMTRGPDKAKMRLGELNRLGRDISPREQKILTILEVVVEMYARGIAFLPVDIYRSDAERFLIEDRGLRPPLASLAGLGGAAARSICRARDGGGFISVEDLVARSKISKAVVEILKNYGAIDGMAAESQLTLFDIA